MCGAVAGWHVAGWHFPSGLRGDILVALSGVHVPQDLPQNLADYYRHCAGENYTISDAVCFQRRRHHYPKCPGCQWNPATKQIHEKTTESVMHDVSNIEKVYKAYDIRGVYPDPLNEDIAWKTGHAAAQFLRMNLSGLGKADARLNMIIVGHDMRLSSPALSKALIDGILSTGTDVIDIGMIDTPEIYFAINHLGCCGGIQVTASHNPAQYNGFKISGQEARPVGETTGLNEIKRVAMNLRRGPSAQTGRVETKDLAREYKAHVLQFLQLKRPLKVVVDCSNGMAGQFVPNIFVGQPNLQIIALNTEITGRFKHEPNPLVDSNLRELQEGGPLQCGRFRRVL